MVGLLTYLSPRTPSREAQNFAVTLLSEARRESQQRVLSPDFTAFPFNRAFFREPFPAAKRELEEETGYRAKTWKELGFINTSPGFCNEKLYLYKAEDLKFTHCHPDEGEIIQAFEYSYDEVLKMIDNGEISDAKSLCALLKAKIKG